MKAIDPDRIELLRDASGRLGTDVKPASVRPGDRSYRSGCTGASKSPLTSGFAT